MYDKRVVVCVPSWVGNGQANFDLATEKVPTLPHPTRAKRPNSVCARVTKNVKIDTALYRGMCVQLMYRLNKDGLYGKPLNPKPENRLRDKRMPPSLSLARSKGS